jgi:hypothetical protein
VKFGKHYTRDEARALLPQIRTWLKRLLRLRNAIERSDGALRELMAPGRDIGGALVNKYVRAVVDAELVLHEFLQREIEVKDLDRGLVDFPAIIAGKEVFLCWERDEADIEFWHDLDTGYAGRQRL